MAKIKAILFWILSLTWGLPMTLFGAFVALVLLIRGYKPKLYYHFIYFEVGYGWGGLEAGGFFFVNKNPSDRIKLHEAGHGLQNIVFGVFMPFVVSIPSAVRYWYREYLVRSGKKKYHELPDYDAIWFEGWATKLGEKYFNRKED